jgi:hypothetical protein
MNSSEHNPETSKPATSGLGNLPQFPSDGEPEIVIRARQIPIVEITAGVILGAVVGGLLGWNFLAAGIVAGLIALVAPTVIGGLIGWVVGYVTGPTGEFSVRTVLAAVPRVLLVALIGWFFGMLGIIFVPRRPPDDD